MKIAYYITSHGFGHGIRACAICNSLSPETEVVFRTALPGSFLEEEVKRPFEYAPKSFDCGCVQLDGVTVDIERTIESYRIMADRNAAALSEEIKWCHRRHIDGIVSDIVPFAFDVADGAGFPSIAVTNFTWHDIYREYCGAFPAFLPAVEKMKEQYGTADLLLELSPALPMEYFRKRKSIAPVGRAGSDIRGQFLKTYGIPASKSIGLIYTGIYGMHSVSWTRLERFIDWEFFGLYPLPGSPANYHIVKKKDFRYQDIIASIDCVISKIGYGVYAECVINGAPLIYLPREGFAEYPVLEAAIIGWGGGHRLSQKDFENVAWDAALRQVLSGIRPRRPRPQPSDGARTCAREIEKLFQ
jgi:hypothetical protein